MFSAWGGDVERRLRAEFAQRLMKARKGLAAFTIMAAAFGLGLGLAWNAGLFGGGAVAEATETAAVRSEAARRAERKAADEADWEAAQEDLDPEYFAHEDVKFGRWTYPARQDHEGNVQRNTKRDGSGEWVLFEVTL